MQLFEEYKKDINEAEKQRELSMAAFLKTLLSTKTLKITGKDDGLPWVVDFDDPEYKVIHAAIEKRYKRAAAIAGVEESVTPLFTDYKASKDIGIEYLSEEENQMVDEYVNVFETEYAGKIEEGILGRIVGGLSGFLVGPTIGKIIAKALGIEKGVLYDMFTSRLVSTALGSAIGKYMTENKGKIK